MLQQHIMVVTTKGETKPLVPRCPRPPPTEKLSTKIYKTWTSKRWIEVGLKFRHTFLYRKWILLRPMVTPSHSSGSISLLNRLNICHQIYRVWLGYKLHIFSNSLDCSRRGLKICSIKLKIQMLMLYSSLSSLAASISITIMFTSWTEIKLIHLRNSHLNQAPCHLLMSKSNQVHDDKACQVQVVWQLSRDPTAISSSITNL